MTTILAHMVARYDEKQREEAAERWRATLASALFTIKAMYEMPEYNYERTLSYVIGSDEAQKVARRYALSYRRYFQDHCTQDSAPKRIVAATAHHIEPFIVEVLR
jgi:hypothetical protein